MSKIYISKEKFAIIWGKIASLFVAKEAGKGLSTNDYDNAAVAEVAKIGGKADAATSLSGYGITDAYTKEEIDATVNELKADMGSVYKIKGTITFASLPTEGMVEGDVYNISDSFTVVEGFVDYVTNAETQKTFPAGTNVVYTANGWDCLAGTYDFSGFMKKDDIVDITEEEINAICVLPS